MLGWLEVVAWGRVRRIWILRINAELHIIWKYDFWGIGKMDFNFDEFKSRGQHEKDAEAGYLETISEFAWVQTDTKKPSVEMAGRSTFRMCTDM